MEAVLRNGHDLVNPHHHQPERKVKYAEMEELKATNSTGIRISIPATQGPVQQLERWHVSANNKRHGACGRGYRKLHVCLSVGIGHGHGGESNGLYWRRTGVVAGDRGVDPAAMAHTGSFLSPLPHCARLSLVLPWQNGYSGPGKPD